MSEAEGCLYLIFMYSGGKYSHSFHRIELSHLNLSSEGESSSQETKKLPELPKPLLELPYESYPGFMSFVHFKGKIYMFGGEDHSQGKQGKLSERCYVFDTNKPENGVNDGPPMKKAKFRPIVLGPIENIFYVLSSNLASGDLEKFQPTGDLEKFQPTSESDDESWTVLKQFPFASKGRQHKYEVLSYAIVKNLLIFSTHKGIFTYHVMDNYWTSSRGEKDDGINMGTWGDEKMNTLGAESSEKDNWKEMKMLPFIDEAKLLDPFWYAFSSPKAFALAAYHFNVDERELQSYESYEVRGLVSPSGNAEHEMVNIMVPLGGEKFCIVSSGLYESRVQFCVTVDMYQLSETTGGSNGKSKYVEVSKKRSATYDAKRDPEWTPLTTTCVFMPVFKPKNAADPHPHPHVDVAD